MEGDLEYAALFAYESFARLDSLSWDVPRSPP